MINYLTVAGVFGAFIAGQYFSSNYKVNRENKKCYKECLQNLYSPLINKVIDYLLYESEKSCYTVDPNLSEVRETKPLCLKGDTNKTFNEILSTIGDKLIYAHEDLIMEYEAAEKYGEFIFRQNKSDFFDTIQVQRNRMEVCAAILSGYLSINRRLKTLSKRVKDEIEAAYFFTLLFLILLDLRLHELAVDCLLKDMKLVMTGYRNNQYLLKTVELIRFRYKHAESHSEKFSLFEKNQLEVDSFQTILKLIDSMENLDTKKAGFWRMQINQRRQNVESLVIKDLLDR